MELSAASAHPQTRERALRLAVVTTFFSLIPTAYATFQSNSIVLLTDLLRCSIEFLAIFLSWLILRRIASGGRVRFDYGHGKLEQVSSVLVAVAMIGTFLAIAISALSRVSTPVPVENVEFGFILGVLSILGNAFLWQRYRLLSTKAISPLMDSQARLFRAKTFATIIIVLSLFPNMLGTTHPLILLADPIGSLCLGFLLLHSAIGLLSSSTKELLDCSLEEALQLSILRVLVELDSDYLGLKQIRSRRSGGKVQIELFLEFSADLLLREVDEKSRKIVNRIKNAIPSSETIVVPSPAN